MKASMLTWFKIEKDLAIHLFMQLTMSAETYNWAPLKDKHDVTQKCYGSKLVD